MDGLVQPPAVDNALTPSILSTKAIPSRERLIIPLDVPTVKEAKALVNLLGNAAHFYKLGLEICMAEGFHGLIDWLVERQKKVFVDIKFFDVPATVSSAVRQLCNRGVSFATVHGDDNMLRAAAEQKEGVKILAVTVLTSLNRQDLRDLGFSCDEKQLVLSRARRALLLGCDGVISSGLEAPALRNELGSNFLIIVPGIRPVDNVDDHKRTVDLEDAFRRGADYVVVGRPIRNAADPMAEAERHQARIAALFQSEF